MDQIIYFAIEVSNLLFILFSEKFLLEHGSDSALDNLCPIFFNFHDLHTIWSHYSYILIRVFMYFTLSLDYPLSCRYIIPQINFIGRVTLCIMCTCRIDIQTNARRFLSLFHVSSIWKVTNSLFTASLVLYQLNLMHLLLLMFVVSARWSCSRFWEIKEDSPAGAIFLQNVQETAC